MRIQSRTTIVFAIALAAAVAAAPAGAQEVLRPNPHGGGGPHAAGPHGGPHPAGPHGGAGPRGFAAPNGALQAQQPRRGGNAAGVAAGVIGGLAAGAVLGGILSNRGAVAEPAVGPGDGCPLVRRPVYDGSGGFAGYQTVPSC